MQTIKLQLGSEWVANSYPQSQLRDVEFTGEEIAEHNHCDDDRGNRGRDEILYRTNEEQSRLVVYVREWSNWQGETSTYHLVEVTEADLGIGGRFELLGREAGMSRAITLDQALAPDY